LPRILKVPENQLFGVSSFFGETNGHNVPEIDERRRYLRSFENLPLAIKNADHFLLFDDSRERGYQLVGILSRTKSEWFSPLRSWDTELEATFA
jgi:predicted ABC-type ATPase